MRQLALLGVLLLTSALPAPADEGMWLFNQPPRAEIKKRYGFDLTDQFLEHMRRASVRFNNGGSGSFISPEGLLFTNHHVGADCIAKLSSAEHDYMNNGFYAASMSEEKACPDLEVNVLLKIEDVTAKVNEGVKPGSTSAAVNEVQKANMARIEAACNKESGNRCDVVTLFSGGQFSVYQYKKYTDIRLVFAPELGIAAFGGDPDNFTYPRYDLDFALFRAYENGQPVKPMDYFAWSKEGAKDGELVFVPGNPGSTGRLATMAQLHFYRDVAYPLVYARLGSLIKTLEDFGAQSPENKRLVYDNLFGMQNSYKAYTGFLRGLRDPNLMNRKRDEEQALRAQIDKNPKERAEYGKTWDQVAAAYKNFATFYKPYALLERYAPLGSDLLHIARQIVRVSEERTKPNDKRLSEYTDAKLPSLEQEMFSPAPIYPSMEIAVLADTFQFMEKELGANDPTVKAVLQGKRPAEAARHYVETSNLEDIDVRKQLASSYDAVKNSKDGMIQLALILDGPARKVRKRYEDTVEAVDKESAAKIAQARFAVHGTSEYPDATFTLRLAFGVVKGYKNDAGQWVPWATTFEGLFKRAGNEEPYILPERWVKAKADVNLNVPFNFVSTADTHGGNSGSPTLNTKGEIVGILFDGNIEGLPNRFIFTDEQARSVHVASQGIVEALRNVYKTDRLLKELGQ
jgi:hypothetical protein